MFGHDEIIIGQFVCFDRMAKLRQAMTRGKRKTESIALAHYLANISLNCEKSADGRKNNSV